MNIMQNQHTKNEFNRQHYHVMLDDAMNLTKEGDFFLPMFVQFILEEGAQKISKLEDAILDDDENEKEKPTEREILEEVADELNAKFVFDYSGRGMNSKTCLGIICEEPYQICLELGKRGFNKTPRQDNMGRQTIIYWPSISLDNP
jgi:hypothetical protein